ncbi:MAG: protease inhibitor I42 family protein, partial [Pirellulaceae bacterium]|nr:protease inhibitor I42 family protein [Pirellulaceae bacterium]
MRKSIAIQVLLATLVSFLSVERAYSDDLKKVLESQNKWEELKTTHAGDYQYVVKWEGFSPTGRETTIFVRNNQVIGRNYKTFTSWEEADPNVVHEAWSEVTDDLGSHKQGAPPKTLDAVYQEAIKIAGRKLEDYEKRFVTFDNRGLLLKCCVDDERIADDGCRGVELSSIRFAAEEPQRRERELQLTAESNGQNFQVPVGGTISVQLEGNRTTGFSWNNATQSENIELVGEIQYAAKESLPGSGGVATANFRATKVGKATLVLEYKRSFENKPAAKTFQVTIEVQESGSVDEAKRTYQSPNGKEFPAYWGAPPKIQTRDLRPLPGGYGKGSGTLARWIQANLDNELGLTVKDNGQDFQVPVGGIISVQLEGNRTTGFSWNNATKSETIEMLGEIQYASKESLPGSGGVATATFRASKVGKATLILEYKRVFEKKPAAKTFQITVEVQEPGSEGEE